MKNENEKNKMKANSSNPSNQDTNTIDDDSINLLKQEMKELEQKNLEMELHREESARELSRISTERDELKKTLSNLSRSFALLQDKFKEKESAQDRDIEATISQNYRKVAKELLEVLDNIDRIKEIILMNREGINRCKNKEAVTIINGLEQGVEMIDVQFRNVLKNNLEVEEIKTDEGDAIDLDNHMELQAEKNLEKPNKHVLKVVRKGYKYKNQLLRPVLIIANRY